MTVKRTISLDALLDESIAKLALRNKTSYSGFVDRVLLQHPAIIETMSQLEKLPKFPELTDEELQETMKEEPITN